VHHIGAGTALTADAGNGPFLTSLRAIAIASTVRLRGVVTLSQRPPCAAQVYVDLNDDHVFKKFKLSELITESKVIVFAPDYLLQVQIQRVV
jgi:hypothetical protein